jgi:predicted aspartyl protease
MPQVKVFGFTARFDKIANVLATPAHIGSPFDPKSPPITSNPKPFNAIWDTGATRTVISKNVVQSCNLKPTGMAKVHTASGTDIVPTYYVSIGLPNKIVIPILKVTQGVLTGTDVLIGMDIINSGDFAVTNKDGNTVFSFRMPSLECIDFVKTYEDKKKLGQPFPPSVGRNDPCPCDSGKKYKKCHGRGAL